MEIWKDIPGTNGHYQISNLGRVKSNSFMRSNGHSFYLQKGRILKPFMEKCGHLKIGLRINGKSCKFKVHRLVGMAFIPNPENKPEIDHINTNTLDNRVENLRWVTSKENHANPLTKQHVIDTRKRINYKYFKPVIALSSDKQIEFNSIKDASLKLKICSAHISSCCKGKRKTAGGYKWQYA